MSDRSVDEPAADGAPPGAVVVIDPPSVDSEAVTDLPAEPEPEPRLGWARRAGRRIIRRPKDWFDRPWPAERVVQYLTALILVGGATFAALKAVHPDLVLTDNTPTGGDMGAHVMGPAYLRDQLLPNWQLSGWSNYWYDGFPLYRFYMVIPALMIVALNVVLPYGIAFKIVAVLGIVTLPVCCWAFGRLARFRYPIPELMALAGMMFLFDESFSIYGGNVKSTMAGEFSFSIALSLGILGLGVFARGLETGKFRSWAAVLIALSMLSHGIVLLVVVGAAFLLWLVWMDRTRFVYGATVLGAAALLSAFWVLPFLGNHAYMTDMKYGYLPDGGGTSFWDMFFPWPNFLDFLITGFALIGFVVSVVKRHLNGAWLGLVCLALVAGVYLARDSLPVIGLLWNPRLLPFLYLFRLLLAMVGVVETADAIMRLSWPGRLTERGLLTGRAVTAGIVGLTVLVGELFLFQEVPGARFTTKDGANVYSWGIGGWDPISLTPNAEDALSDSWSRYNFLGYEARPQYAEYKALIDQMSALGDDPAHGCGRALWENNSANGDYGTTMALMLLPHWTDGCIPSSEGLFFEASGTTPYHFLAAAAMSESSSNPVRELRYVNNDADVGVPMLQALGIKYAMVFTEAARREADAHPDLTLLAEVGPWGIYEVAGADLVVPLTMQPVVVERRSGDQRERHLELGTSWFQQPEEWAALPADDGPEEWQRIHVDVDESRAEPSPENPDAGKKVDIVLPREIIVPEELPPVEVSNVQLGEQDLSFDVDQVGVPVLVRMSYFPNWKVDGADGPYRVAPNLMVVVPTDTHVRLHYGRVPIDYIAYLLTLAGVAMLIVMRVRGDVRHRNPSPLAAGVGRVAPPLLVATPVGPAAYDDPDDLFWALDDHVPRDPDATGMEEPIQQRGEPPVEPRDQPPDDPSGTDRPTIDPPGAEGR